jgi:hypothetical protein
MVMMDMIRRELLRARKESDELESLRCYAEVFAEQATSRRKLCVEITARLAACDAERAQLEQRLESGEGKERAAAGAALRSLAAKAAATRDEFQSQADAAVQEIREIVTRPELAAAAGAGVGRQRVAAEARELSIKAAVLEAGAHALRESRGSAWLQAKAHFEAIFDELHGTRGLPAAVSGGR